jgi:hypothetical protein
MDFSKLDTGYAEVLSKLAERSRLTRREIAEILDPHFPYLPRPEKLIYILEKADKCVENLEKFGLAIKFNYKRKDYTIQITEKGLEHAKRLVKER